jgi:hypothetical protein
MSEDFEDFCDKEDGYATELEWLRFFAENIDPSHNNADQHIEMEKAFEEITGKKVPREWSWR